MKKLSIRNFLYLLFISACGTSNKSTQTPQPPPQLSSNDPAIHTQANPPSHPADPHASQGDGAAAPAVHSHTVPSGVSGDQALKWLKNGNLRFIKNSRRSDGLGPKDRSRLTTGQKPHSIVLSCSDSRVPPEHVFDQSLGEIFVIRVAGEVLDYSVIGSIEYAVEHLGSRLIFVMGHESCGAVKAALSTPKGQSAGSPSLDKLVADIQPRLYDEKLPASPATHSPNVVKESSLNAKGVATDLLNRSTIIRNAVASGKVKLASGLYYLKSGQVEFFN